MIRAWTAWRLRTTYNSTNRKASTAKDNKTTQPSELRIERGNSPVPRIGSPFLQSINHSLVSQRCSGCALCMHEETDRDRDTCAPSLSLAAWGQLLICNIFQAKPPISTAPRGPASVHVSCAFTSSHSTLPLIRGQTFPSLCIRLVSKWLWPRPGIRMWANLRY